MSKEETIKGENAKGHGIFLVWVALLCLGTVGALGFLNIAYPDEYVIWFLCLVSFISGIVCILRFFKNEEFKIMTNCNYALGIILMVCSVIFAVEYDVLIPLMPVLFAFLELCIGAYALQAALASRRLYCANWIVTFVVSLPALACALYTFVYRDSTELYSGIGYFGGMCVSAGCALIALLLNLLAGLLYSKNYKKVMDRKYRDAKLFIEEHTDTQVNVKVSKKVLREQKKAEKATLKESKKAEKEAAKSKAKAEKKPEAAPVIPADAFVDEDVDSKPEETAEVKKDDSDIFVDEDPKDENSDKVIPLKSASNQ